MLFLSIMNEADFEKLCESIKQAGEIKRGVRKPSRVFDSSRGVFLLMVGAASVAYGFDPVGPPPEKTVEWTTRHIVHVTVPFVDFDRTPLEGALDFVNRPDIPKAYKPEIDCGALGQDSKLVVSLKAKDLSKIEILGKIAEQVHADIIISPGRVALVPRKIVPKAPDRPR